MSMTTPIVDFVRSYAQSGTARLHMPGHKGQSLLGFEPLDITEICGADELYAPEGIIAESEANATRLFGTAHSYYSTEGSSQSPFMHDEKSVHAKAKIRRYVVFILIVFFMVLTFV